MRGKSRATFKASALALACAGLLSCETPSAKPAFVETAVSSPSLSVIVAVRRTSEDQYRQAIADVFGPEIKVNAKFEPEIRREGLLASGAENGSISANGFEQYFAAARSIATQAMDEKVRGRIVSCAPKDPKASDDACAQQFISKVGRRLFRRALTDDEIAPRVLLAAKASKDAGDLNAGLQAALVSLLTAPDFLFRIERALPVNAPASSWTLDGYSRAARISYLIWDAPPDDELLTAAESGALTNRAGLEAQVQRLIASPRLEFGVRAFFADLLQLDLFDTLSKDAAQYPKFSQAVASSAKEQTLKVVTDTLTTGKGDYRDIFTTRNTFIDRYLGAIYKVPFASDTDWTKYEFAKESGQSGVLTQVTFTALFAHPGRSSPTKRGVALNDIFLCQTVPQPPADVDLSALTNGATVGKTVRERLQSHREQPLCAACHQLTDPMGLALEQFDGIGQKRLTENGAPIDVSVDVMGKPISGASGLGEALRDDPRVPACLINRVYAYGVGRQLDSQDRSAISESTKAFVGDGYNVVRAMARLAVSDTFFTTPAPAARTNGDAQ